MQTLVGFFLKCKMNLDSNSHIKLISTVLHLLTPETLDSSNSVHIMSVNFCGNRLDSELAIPIHAKRQYDHNRFMLLGYYHHTLID